MDGTHLSLRFKHGVHTIFLFVDPLQPISAMTTLLADVLRERYPSGELTTTQGPTFIPSGDDLEARVVYGTPTNPVDPAEGWQRLEAKAGDTPSRRGIRDGSVLAFGFTTDGGALADVDFVVDWPSVEEFEDGDETLEP